MKIIKALLTQDEKIWLNLGLACKKAREFSLPTLKKKYAKNIMIMFILSMDWITIYPKVCFHLKQIAT